MNRLFVFLPLVLACGGNRPSRRASQTPIEFTSHGLEYEALPKRASRDVRVPAATHQRFQYYSGHRNHGSPVSWTVKPADFSFVRQDGVVLASVSADQVVESMLQKAGRNDVIKLQLLYEDSIMRYRIFARQTDTSSAREAAMAQFVDRGFKAAAAASAITMVAISSRLETYRWCRVLLKFGLKQNL